MEQHSLILLQRPLPTLPPPQVATALYSGLLLLLLLTLLLFVFTALLLKLLLLLLLLGSGLTGRGVGRAVGLLVGTSVNRAGEQEVPE